MTVKKVEQYEFTTLIVIENQHVEVQWVFGMGPDGWLLHRFLPRFKPEEDEWGYDSSSLISLEESLREAESKLNELTDDPIKKSEMHVSVPKLCQ